MDIKTKRTLLRKSKDTESGKESDADYVPPHQIESNFRKSLHQAKKQTDPEILVKIPKRKLGGLNKIWDQNYNAQQDVDKCKSVKKNLDSIITEISNKYFIGKTKLRPYLATHLTKSKKNGDTNRENFEDNRGQNCPEMTNNNNKAPAVRRTHFKKDIIRQHSTPTEIYNPPEDNNGHASECGDHHSEAVQSNTTSYNIHKEDTINYVPEYIITIEEPPPTMTAEANVIKDTSEEAAHQAVQLSLTKSVVDENQSVGKHNLPTTIITQQRSRVALPLNAESQKKSQDVPQSNVIVSPRKSCDTRETHQTFQYPSVYQNRMLLADSATDEYMKMQELNRQLARKSNFVSKERRDNFELYESHCDQINAGNPPSYSQAVKMAGKIKRNRRFSEAALRSQRDSVNDAQNRTSADLEYPRGIIMFPPPPNVFVNKNCHAANSNIPYQLANRYLTRENGRELALPNGNMQCGNLVLLRPQPPVLDNMTRNQHGPYPINLRDPRCLHNATGLYQQTSNSKLIPPNNSNIKLKEKYWCTHPVTGHTQSAFHPKHNRVNGDLNLQIPTQNLEMCSKNKILKHPPMVVTSPDHENNLNIPNDFNVVKEMVKNNEKDTPIIHHNDQLCENSTTIINVRERCASLDLVLKKIKWNTNNILDLVNINDSTKVFFEDYWKSEGYYKFKTYLINLNDAIHEIKELDAAQRKIEVSQSGKFAENLEGFVKHSITILTTKIERELKNDYIKYVNNFLNHLDYLYLDHKKKYVEILQKMLAKDTKTNSTGEVLTGTKRKQSIQSCDDNIANKKNRTIESATQTILPDEGDHSNDKANCDDSQTTREMARAKIDKEDSSGNFISEKINHEDTKPVDPKGRTNTQNNYITIMQCPNGPAIQIANNKCQCDLNITSTKITCPNICGKNIPMIKVITEVKEPDIIDPKKSDKAETPSDLNSTKFVKVEQVPNITSDNTSTLKLKLPDGADIKDLPPNETIKPERLIAQEPKQIRNMRRMETVSRETNSIIDCETYIPKQRKRKNLFENKLFVYKRKIYRHDRKVVIVIDSDQEDDTKDEFIVIDGNENSNDEVTVSKENVEDVAEKDDENSSTSQNITPEAHKEHCEKLIEILSDANENTQAQNETDAELQSNNLAQQASTETNVIEANENASKQTPFTMANILNLTNVNPIDANTKVSIPSITNSVVKYVSGPSNLVEPNRFNIMEPQAELRNTIAIDSQNKIHENRPQILENILTEQSSAKTRQHSNNVDATKKDDNVIAQKTLVRNSIINLLNKNKNPQNTLSPPHCAKQTNPYPLNNGHEIRTSPSQQTKNTSVPSIKRIDDFLRHSNTLQTDADHNYHVENTTIQHTNSRESSFHKNHDNYLRIVNGKSKNNTEKPAPPKEQSVINVKNNSDHSISCLLKKSNGNGIGLPGRVGIIPQIHKLKAKDHLSAEEYVEEVAAVDEMDISTTYKRFYYYITKQQILQWLNPIGFRVFLELLNNGGLQEFYTKYLEYQKKQAADLHATASTAENIG